MSSREQITTQLTWRGIHHVALATGNLDATIHFYKEVLDMQVSDIAPSREGRGRHCMVLMKPGDKETLGFHFFERPEEEILPALTPSFAGGKTSGFLFHIALRLPDDNAARLLRERLGRAQISITEIPELGSFIFPDNNGMLLEVTWPKE